MNRTQTPSLSSIRLVKILGFFSFGIGLAVRILPFASVLMRSYLLTHGLWAIIPFAVAGVSLAIAVIVYPASSLCDRILAIIGMLSSVVGLFVPLILSFH